MSEKEGTSPLVVGAVVVGTLVVGYMIFSDRSEPQPTNTQSQSSDSVWARLAEGAVVGLGRVFSGSGASNTSPMPPRPTSGSNNPGASTGTNTQNAPGWNWQNGTDISSWERWTG